MGDFNGIPPFAASAAARIDVHARPPVLPPVEPALPAQGTGERPASDPGTGRDSRTRDIDENTPTGPPPAFSANVLELDRTMRDAMARLEAAHALPRAEAAIALSPTSAPSEGA